MNIYTINRGIFKRLYAYFAYLSTRSIYRGHIKQKINKLKCNPLTRSQKKEIKEYYNSFGFKNISTDWHRYYTHLTGNFYKEYIPEDFFYNVIEPSLNMRIMFPALTDKNLLDILFSGIEKPKSIIKNINGVYIEASSNEILTFEEAVGLCNRYHRLVIKPTIESGGGINVSILNINNGITNQQNLTVDQVLRNYSKNFVVQECLNQHEQMKLLNESSVNTLRIKTLLIKDKIVILNSVVRIGMKGSKVDNMKQGGYIMRIQDNGKLSQNGFFGNGKIIGQSDLDFDIEKFEIPTYNYILSVVKKLHNQILHFKMISWDIAIDLKGQPVLIEYNVFGQGVGQEYKSLFGEYTDDVLKCCKVNRFFS